MTSTRRAFVALLLLLALTAPQFVATTNSSSVSAGNVQAHGTRTEDIEEGLERGDSGDGVAALQTYLDTYGYMRSRSYQSRNFDAATEDALKDFQRTFGLVPSGRVDHETHDLLTTPRYDDRPDAAGLGEPEASGYVLSGTSWDDPNLTYAYDNFTSDISQTAQKSAMDQALNTWAAVTPLTFTEVSMSQNPEIVISFETGDHGDGSLNAFDGPGGILAHAFYPPNTDPPGMSLHGDAHFDDAESWTVTIPVPGGGIDLVTVAIHEFGHSLGLGHSNNNSSIMAPYYTGANRTLHSDDIAGIQSLYGSGGGGGIVDAEVLSISMSPSSTIVGNAVTGTVSVRNNGDQAAAIPVTVTGPSNFSYSTTTASLASGASTSFNFRWTPSSAGTFTLTATANLSNDEDSRNDSKSSNAVSVSETPQTIDAEVVSASASPTSITQNSGNVTITASVRNNGSSTAVVPISVSGPNNWSNSTSRTLDSGSSTTVQFSWPASALGTHNFTVSTSLTGDSNAGNNSKTTNNVTVNAPQTTTDAEVVSASASPTSITQNDGNISISATIRNNGTSTATIPVNVSGPSSWSDSTTRTLASGASTTVQFSWPASVVGNHSFTVSTSVSGDQNAANNSKTTNNVTVSSPPSGNTIFVNGVNVTATPNGSGHTLQAVVTIGPNASAGSGAYMYGYWINPQNQYRFAYGYGDSSGRVTLSTTTTLTGLHKFQVYYVGKSGMQYDSSQNVGNPGSVDVGGGSQPTIDASVNSVTANPTSIALNGGNVTITATIGNNGDNAATIPVSISGPSGYNSSQNVSVGAGNTQQVNFTWPASVVGDHTFTVTTSLSGDSNAGNNQGTSPTVSVTQSSVVDAAVLSLSGSTNSVEQNGPAITFTASVKNNGTSSATFNVRLTSGSASVNTSKSVTLASGASQNVTFQWNPTVVGNHSFTATAELSGDSNAGNNSKATSVSVTEPPPPGSESVFVDRIYVIKVGSYWFVYTWIDSTDGQAFSGAVISATVRAASGQTKQVSAPTGSGGYSFMYVTPIGSGTHTYTVDSISLSGYTYDASLNGQTSVDLP